MGNYQGIVATSKRGQGNAGQGGKPAFPHLMEKGENPMNMKCVVLVLLAVSLLFAGGPWAIPQAEAIPPMPVVPAGGGTDSLKNKGVLIGLPPGTIIAHFVVKGKNTPVFDENGKPNGEFQGDIVGPADGKPAEVSLAVSNTDDPATAAQNRLFIWTEEGGYELLSTLTVLNQFPETKIWVDDPPLDDDALLLEPELEMGEPVMAPPLPSKLEDDIE